MLVGGPGGGRSLQGAARTWGTKQHRLTSSLRRADPCRDGGERGPWERAAQLCEGLEGNSRLSPTQTSAESRKGNRLPFGLESKTGIGKEGAFPVATATQMAE